MSRTPEGSVKDEVLKACRKHPLVSKVWKTSSGQVKMIGSGRRYRLNQVGAPDIVGFSRDGRFIGIECKAGKATPSDDQTTFLAELAQSRCICGVALSAEDAIEILNEHATAEAVFHHGSHSSVPSQQTA